MAARGLVASLMSMSYRITASSSVKVSAEVFHESNFGRVIARKFLDADKQFQCSE